MPSAAPSCDLVPYLIIMVKQTIVVVAPNDAILGREPQRRPQAGNEPSPKPASRFQTTPKQMRPLERGRMLAELLSRQLADAS